MKKWRELRAVLYSQSFHAVQNCCWVLLILCNAAVAVKKAISSDRKSSSSLYKKLVHKLLFKIWPAFIIFESVFSNGCSSIAVQYCVYGKLLTFAQYSTGYRYIWHCIMIVSLYCNLMWQAYYFKLNERNWKCAIFWWKVKSFKGLNKFSNRRVHILSGSHKYCMWALF